MTDKITSVSVIIPVFNAGRFLRRALDGLISQTFTNWQAICINDGSTDDSAQILAEYAERDGRFIVINKENTGVSDTRNIGVAKACSEYVMFHDADDFIHPQTVEIAYGLAQREHADMVSFRIDSALYKKLQSEMRQGAEIDTVRPKTLGKKYDIPKIKFKKTSDVISYATERARSPGIWNIRHCYPVVHLYRRDLISDIPFVRGITVSEDFPWLSEVILRRPLTVITRLPLYYYIPNASSALSSAGALRVLDNIIRCILNIYPKYKSAAKVSEMKIWEREFLWPFIITAFRQIAGLNNKKDICAAKVMFMDLENIGALDNPSSFRARRYRRRIKKFIV